MDKNDEIFRRDLKTTRIAPKVENLFVKMDEAMKIIENIGYEKFKAEYQGNFAATKQTVENKNNKQQQN